MAALTYTVLDSDVAYWGTLESIRSNLDVNGDKILEISLDPLIDPSIVDPSQAYRII